MQRSMFFGILLLFALIASLAPLQNVAALVHTKETYAVCGVMPSTIGVGQEVLVWLGISDQLNLYYEGWQGITVTVIKPDNTTQTLGPFKTDSTGSTGTAFVPNMVGKYVLQTHFPAQWYNTTSGGTRHDIWYKASDSEKVDLTVQEDAITYYPGRILPTEYWSRPINSQFREWNVIGGNWLGAAQTADTLAGIVAPYNDYAPETPHILWRKALVTGGLAGGLSAGPYSFEMGDAYEGFFAGAVILDGKLFYNRYNSNGGTRVEQDVIAVDLHTGEELWVRNWNRTQLSFGQVFYFDAWNYHSVFNYLWTTTSTSTMGTVWDAYDATTGRWVYQITNVPSGTRVYGPKGEIYLYTFNLANGWITLWNSSRTIQPQTSNSQSDGSWIRSNTGNAFNASRGYDYNVTIPRGLPGSVNYVYYGDVAFGFYQGGTALRGIALGDPPFTAWAINLNPSKGQIGSILWNKTYSAPQGNVSLIPTEIRCSQEDRVWTLWDKEHRTHYGYSLDTGEKLWGPSEPEAQLGIFETWSIFYDGKLYTHGTKGIIDCYNAKTGEKLWSYKASDPFNEILWSDNWNIRIDFIAAGKIYMRHSEHSPVNPLPRGAPYICLNATTGEEVWRIDGAFRGTDWGGRGYIGDSILVKCNTYDMYIYAITKGPSALTVAAPDIGVPAGSSVTLKGSVTDISPGTKEYAVQARFPNGVPAVSDNSQGEWMKYVYQQFERPSNTVGVQVVLSVVDSNGNYREIGTATTSADGVYSLSWKPDIPGEYKVYASFGGSKSYYPSHAETAFTVDAAPDATAAPTALPQSAADLYFVPAVASIIVAIAIVGVLLALLMLKKRP